ncbi:PTS system mannose/fructose/sorbose family transporter subunit IID [Enterococcus hulanensis]|uniref:PTS system mannose/fructose/sorbose family transporter subunit IID n=1 Tax=Enterococcus hulanensis TaxID=2559929 RepID=UPI001A8DB2F7|nr:PTS system mannose/fructose/sorbose family transporter subunit IID [Enterococcus hulanensis]MBO0456159.1 PTS system mannose/fructose/sorbose family transporter subunit IID [Enterococcus hulanensis]
MEETKNTEGRLDKKVINQSFRRWYWSVEVPSSYERMQGLSFCYSMIPVLQKLHSDPEKLSEAYRRHLTFFNTQGTWGTPIHGITIAMEEEMSAKEVAEEQSDAAITSIKTGLMGPLAGIGDTIDWGTLKTIIYGIGVTFAMTGSAIGAIIPFGFTILTYFIAKYLWNLGYSIGRESVQSILQSGWIDKLITSTAVLGLFMMGALSATYVKLEIPIAFSVGGSDFKIQSIIDSLAPGLLPLGVVFSIYYVLVNKSQKYGLISITIVAVCLLGSLIGLF